jgi:hypothetical protein
MSTERTLADYLGELIGRLAEADPAALARLQRVVGGRRARIRLDDEVADVRFAAAGLVVEEPGAGGVDGEGATDRATTLELLDGYLEVTDALLDGRLHVLGSVDDVDRIFLAIEILLDAAARAPGLQDLADAYRAHPGRESRRSPPAPTAAPERVDPTEQAMLERLGLLPD